jgi:ABC-type histidine transport system ATPase subunit
MDQGAIVEEGSPVELFQNTKTARAKEFLLQILH